MRNTAHYFRLFLPHLLAKGAALDKLCQGPLHNILFPCRQVPHICHFPIITLAKFFPVENRAGATAHRRRLLSAGEPGALSALDNERGEQVLRIFRAQAEFPHPVDVFRRRVLAKRQNDLELHKVCEIENRWFAICNAGTFQRPFEVGQALSFLLIVGNFCSALGAQVSYYRPVLIVEGDGEVVFADTWYVLESQVGVRGATAYHTDRGPSTMTEPHRQAISILEEPVLHWELRSTSFLSRDVALVWHVVVSCDKPRLVLGHGGGKGSAVETLALLRQEP